MHLYISIIFKTHLNLKSNNGLYSTNESKLNGIRKNGNGFYIGNRVYIF